MPESVNNRTELILPSVLYSINIVSIHVCTNVCTIVHTTKIWRSNSQKVRKPDQIYDDKDIKDITNPFLYFLGKEKEKISL